MTSDSPPSAGWHDHGGSAFAAIASLAVCQAPTFVCICDGQLRPRFLNAAGRTMVGLPVDTRIADYDLLDFFTPRHRVVVEAIGLPAILGGEGHWAEDLCLRGLTDPSREIEVRWSAYALRRDGGELMGAAAFTTDISARRQAERALHDQRMLLDSLLDDLPVGVGIYDRHGGLLRSNQRLRDYPGLAHLSSGEPATSSRWQSDDGDNRQIPPEYHPGARALRGETVVPGVDLLYDDANDASRHWLRVSAVPVSREGDGSDQAMVVVQDVDDLKRAAERIEAARAVLASQFRFLDATLSSIPDLVYAFDRQRRFAYANAAMLALFDIPAEEMLGKTFADLGYPGDLADRLNRHIDRILQDGVTVQDEVFYRSPTGQAAYFSFLWGPVHDEDGSVELVVGVSRDTSERHAVEERLRTSEARLRAATDLVGLGIYSWDPATGVLDWDERLRAMWGLPPGAAVDMETYESGIDPDDLGRVRSAIAACIDPAGDGRYGIEYRVRGRDDGIIRHIATSGRTTFEQGRPVSFIGAAIDVSGQRRAEAAIRASEAQFRSFAAHSSNLIWIGDPSAGTIIYRSAAYERIWGQSCGDAPISVAEWMKDVHLDDRQQVEHALATVEAGEVALFEYRLIRPIDGAIRWLRDTSFPIPDETGLVTRIGGITEDLTQEDVRQVYIVSASPDEARRLASLVRGVGYRVRTFGSASAFLDMAPVLTPGCVLVDLRKARDDGLSIPRELKARSLTLPTIVLDALGAGVAAAVAAMKAGAVDYVIETGEADLNVTLATSMAECHGAIRPATRDDNAGARVGRLTSRERDVLVGLVEGGTNKSIAQKLRISPRTVELHRAQVMNRLDASNLTELLQIALAAGVAPSVGETRPQRRTS